MLTAQQTAEQKRTYELEKNPFIILFLFGPKNYLDTSKFLLAAVATLLPVLRHPIKIFISLTHAYKHVRAASNYVACLSGAFCIAYFRAQL